MCSVVASKRKGPCSVPCAFPHSQSYFNVSEWVKFNGVLLGANADHLLGAIAMPRASCAAIALGVTRSKGGLI
jgi:hypothetical protein